MKTLVNGVNTLGSSANKNAYDDELNYISGTPPQDPADLDHINSLQDEEFKFDSI